MSINLVKSQPNLTFQIGGMFNLTPTPNIDCVIGQQTLIWLREYQAPLEQVFTRIKPSFFAICSLFYEGEISAKNIATENVKRREMFHNTYSIPEIKRFASGFGYGVF